MKLQQFYMSLGGLYVIPGLSSRTVTLTLVVETGNSGRQNRKHAVYIYVFADAQFNRSQFNSLRRRPTPDTTRQLAEPEVVLSRLYNRYRSLLYRGASSQSIFARLLRIMVICLW
jgi:hypothetical protein